MEEFVVQLFKYLVEIKNEFVDFVQEKEKEERNLCTLVNNVSKLSVPTFGEYKREKDCVIVDKMNEIFVSESKLQSFWSRTQLPKINNEQISQIDKFKSDFYYKIEQIKYLQIENTNQQVEKHINQNTQYLKQYKIRYIIFKCNYEKDNNEFKINQSIKNYIYNWNYNNKQVDIKYYLKSRNENMCLGNGSVFIQPTHIISSKDICVVVVHNFNGKYEF